MFIFIPDTEIVSLPENNLNKRVIFPIDTLEIGNKSNKKLQKV